MRILFGHQSVGQNILEGMAELARQGRPVPRVVDPDAGCDPDSPLVLAHFRVGVNGRPLSKLANFVGMVTGEHGAKARAALFKFCYVDLFDSESVAALFDAYANAMRKLQEVREDLIVGHVTVPLRAVPPSMVIAGMRLFGRAHPQLAQNAARHEFNERLRARYGDTGTLFDLAALESGGRTAAPALQRRLTDDGGHLNALGREWVAREFVGFLGQLAQRCA